MPQWLLPAVFALTVWSVQRVVSKVALRSLGTRKFYLLSAVVSLLVYLPYVMLHPPQAVALPGALGLACLMALTFGVTTEATRRGPLGVVSPITSLGPAITAGLSVALLHETLTPPHVTGIVLALVGVALLAYRPPQSGVEPGGWLGLAMASPLLQGVGAFIAKIVVTGGGPSALLITSAGVQVVVGLALAPGAGWKPDDLRGRPAIYTVLVFAAAAVATIGYLTALSQGPASLVVPLVATSPALAGLLGIALLREQFSRAQLVGIAASLVGALLLA
jgi:transporter family protein